MRVEVDHAVCEANGVCEIISPEVFELDEEDRLHILHAQVPSEHEEDVREAVSRCPKVALALVEDDAG